MYLESKLKKNGILCCVFLYFCRFIFMKMGEEISDAELDEIIRVADKDGDGKIGWHDFFAVMSE